MMSQPAGAAPQPSPAAVSPAPIQVVDAAGRPFQQTDLGPWRRLTCRLCGNTTPLIPQTADVTEIMLAAHFCGPVGSSWSMAPGPALTIAMLQRSLTQQARAHGLAVFGSGAVAATAHEMIAEVQARLEGAEMAGGIREPEPGHALYVEAMHAKRLAGRLQPGEPVYVTVGELVEARDRWLAGEDGGAAVLPARQFEDGGPWMPATGVLWSDFEECAQHAVENLERTSQRLGPGAVGLVLSEPIDCHSCNPSAVA